MRRPRLYTDVDEVLADFQTPAFAAIKAVTGRVYTSNDFTEWDIFGVLTKDELRAVFDIIEQPGWCANLKPKPGAIEAIKELKTFCEVFPVTSPFHSPTWMYERTQWLGDLFGFSRRQVVHTSSKQLVTADACLDDNTGHVQEWGDAHPGGLPMLWHIANTRTMHEFDDRRVHTWGEVIEKMRGLVGVKNVYELLKEREFSSTLTGYGIEGEELSCLECGVKTSSGGSTTNYRPPRKPKHKPNCRLEQVLRGTTVYDRLLLDDPLEVFDAKSPKEGTSLK